MIIDALLAPLLTVVEWFEGTLPDGEPLGLPDAGGFWEAVAGLNSIAPVSELLTAALALLGVVGVFMVTRMVVTLWNLVWP